jgi:hypothetical protein
MSGYTGTVYRVADGVIVGGIAGTSRDLLGVPAEFSIVDGEYDGKDYRVVDGQVVERAIMTPSISQTTIGADGLDECVIWGLPDPCVVEMRGAVTLVATEVTGGEITITATVLGALMVRVTADPTHKPWETVINAV